MAGDDSNISAAQESHLARVRDNQRRSRARRKEYLQELEEKYRRCEQQGIEASAEMQQAARRVLDENRRLRAALRQRGLSDEEIDIYARGLEQESATSHLENMVSATAARTSNAAVDQGDTRVLSPTSTDGSVGATSSRELSGSPEVSYTNANGVMNLRDAQSPIQPRGQFDQHQPFQPILPSSGSQHPLMGINTSLPSTIPSSTPSMSPANQTSFVNSFHPAPSSYGNFPFGRPNPQQQQQFPILPSNEPWTSPQSQILQGAPQAVPARANYASGYQPQFPQHVQDRRGIPHYEPPGGVSGFPNQQGLGVSSQVVDRKPSVAETGQHVWNQEQWRRQQQQQQSAPQAHDQPQQRRPSIEFSQDQ